ncbi:MAG: hypothetical protein IKC03_00475 [Oscillospiraceae bacterium]|nr:hypothetical protein [Oscillospiraceae bacterium]
MKYIESYNSSYPLAYYEIGNVYSFYGPAYAKGTPANADAIKKYASVLNELVEEEQESAIKPIKGTASSSSVRRGGFNRFYAVVIDKVKSGNSAYIMVMLCNKHNGKSEYYTRKYSVNFGCTTDGKDLMPASAHLDFESKISGKVGGITLAGRDEKTGGITRANGKHSSPPSIGGITRTHQSGNQDSGTAHSGARVGGITLVKEKKIGGITIAKG